MASGGSSINLGSDDCSLECDLCKFRGIKSQAVFYCIECTEALCSGCNDVHGASKKSRNHTLLTGDQMPSISGGSQVKPSVMTCDKHQLKIEYLCKDDNVVMCSTCKMTSHRKCNTIEISTHTAKNDPRKPFSSMQDRLKKLEMSYNNLHQKRTLDKTKLKVQIQNCIEEVRNVRKQVEQHLLTLERKMIAEIKDVQNKLNKEIEEQLTVATNTTRQIQDMFASIDECQKTGQRDAMFVRLKKTEPEIQEYSTLINDLEKELNEINIRFKPDEFFTTSLNELQSIGQLTEPVCSQDVADVSVLDLTVNEERVHDVGCSYVGLTSVVFLPDGHVVLACENDGLILMDEEFQQQSQLSMKANAACRTSDTEVLVSQYNKKQLSFVDILPKMTTKSVLNIGASCNAVDYYNGEIYAACRNDPGKEEVRVLNMNGNVNRRLGVNDGRYMFSYIRDIKVNRTGDKIYIADGHGEFVTCMDQQGHVIYRYTDSNMKIPRGIYVDSHDNILLCGYYSRNVQVITAAGTKHKELLTLKEGLGVPYCISYRPSDGCLAIGLFNDNCRTLVTYDCST